MTIQREIGDRRGIAFSLEAFARQIVEMHAITPPLPVKGAASSGESLSMLRKAARLWGAAQALRVKIDAVLSPTERTELEQKYVAVREALGETEWTKTWEEGQRMTLEQAISYALGEREITGKG